MVVGVYE
jgi:hypothetical protein